MRNGLAPASPPKNKRQAGPARQAGDSAAEAGSRRRRITSASPVPARNNVTISPPYTETMAPYGCRAHGLNQPTKIGEDNPPTAPARANAIITPAVNGRQLRVSNAPTIPTMP